MSSRSTAPLPDSTDLFADAPRTRYLVDGAMGVFPGEDASGSALVHAFNPYRGCEHGCIFCDVRPAPSGFRRSPGSDFETKIFHRQDAARLLRRELSKPDYRCLPLDIGTETDAYQPAERQLRLTRSALEMLYEQRHPATLTTRSALVVRDVELLAAMARLNLVQVTIALSTLDPSLARKLEPRAATPQARLDTMRELSEAGIPVGVMFAPIIPGVTDQEMEEVLAAAFAAGARAARHAALRLPRGAHGLFDQWLARHAPDKAARILAILYSASGERNASHQMRGLAHFSDLTEQRFRFACRRIGFSAAPELDCNQFRAPQSGSETGAPAIAQGLLF